MNQLDGHHPANSQGYKRKRIKLWIRKQFVPEQCGTGCVGVRKPPSKSLKVQSTSPHLPPGSGKSWHSSSSPSGSSPQARSSTPRYLAIPKGCRLWLQILPSLLLRMCPIHLGPSEKTQSRTEQGDPALITAGSSSPDWDDFRNQLGLILSFGRLL